MRPQTPSVIILLLLLFYYFTIVLFYYFITIFFRKILFDALGGSLEDKAVVQRSKQSDQDLRGLAEMYS